MGPNALISFGIQVFVLTTGLLLRSVHTTSDYYSNNYDYGDETNDIYEYVPPQVGNLKNQDDYGQPEVEPFLCYACHYEINGDQVLGKANCDDPFNEFDIGTVQCISSCAKFRKTIRDGGQKDDYSITRICLKNCEEKHDGQEFMECCQGNKCNGARSRSVTFGLSIVTYVITLTLAVALAS